MPAPADLTHENSTSAGTGNFALFAVNGRQRFSAAFGTGVTLNIFDYFITNQATVEWERGTGHMSDTNTLVRDTVIASSNANAAVSFSLGTKDIVNDIPAAKQCLRDALVGTILTTGPSYAAQLSDSRIILNATGTPVTAVTLPSVALWVASVFRQLQPPFDNSLWIKDLAGVAGANNVVITPFGTQKIDTLSSFQLVSNHALIRLYPVSDLSGWFVG